MPCERIYDRLRQHNVEFTFLRRCLVTQENLLSAMRWIDLRGVLGVLDIFDVFGILDVFVVLAFFGILIVVSQ